MRRRQITRRTGRAALVTLLLAATAYATAPDAKAAPAHTTSIFAALDGASERPGPGDPDATGTAAIFINDSTNTLCLVLDATNVDGTGSGLHIHLAPPTAPGPIVVPFTTPTVTNGAAHVEECVVVANEALLDNIAANPQQYYINLHSSPNFGPGAIRGQLSRALVRVRADLTGAAERPGPGDPDGAGTFDAFLDDQRNLLCYFLQYENVDGTPSGLHIHLAPPTAPGPIVVPLTTPTASPAIGCVAVANEALGDNLFQNPEQYYVNLHSTPNFAPGAIRGQLPGCTQTGSGRLTGTAGDDVLCGTGGNEQIFGGGGDDLVYGRGGNDYLDGGDGFDFISGGSSTENSYGQGGDDAIWASGGYDRCQSAVITDQCEVILP